MKILRSVARAIFLAYCVAGSVVCVSAACTILFVGGLIVGKDYQDDLMGYG